MRKLTVAPEVEVIGAVMLSIVNNVRADEIRPLLEKYDLTDIDPQQWYPAHRWLSVMNELAESDGFTSNYVAIGMKVAENVVLPPQLQGAPLSKII